MRLFEARWFWILVSLVLVGLTVVSFLRGEPVFAVIYLLILAVTVARAAGWRPGPR